MGHITNLTSHNLVTEIMQNSFIIMVHFTHWNHALKTHLKNNNYKKMQNCVTFVHSQVCTSYLNTFICVSNMFSMHEIFMLNLWWHKLFFLDENQIKCCSHASMKTKIVTNMTYTRNSYKNVQRLLQMSNSCM
jgi:hypothetical protein